MGILGHFHELVWESSNVCDLTSVINEGALALAFLPFLLLFFVLQPFPGHRGFISACFAVGKPTVTQLFFSGQGVVILVCYVQ